MSLEAQPQYIYLTILCVSADNDVTTQLMTINDINQTVKYNPTQLEGASAMTSSSAHAQIRHNLNVSHSSYQVYL